MIREYDRQAVHGAMERIIANLFPKELSPWVCVYWGGIPDKPCIEVMSREEFERRFPCEEKQP